MMKDVELKLISELMKNSRRSDRELAKVLGVSQPTVSRTIKRLEKEGYIKEYTIVPDFLKLGYQIMGVTLIKRSEPADKDTSTETRKKVAETERRNPHANLMAVNGVGLGKDRLFTTLYEDYSAYSKAIELTKTLPDIEVRGVESFLVDLNDQTNYRVLSMAAIAHHLSLKEKG
jgi:DNA-binding Lrp family transcriptional regulator